MDPAGLNGKFRNPIFFVATGCNPSDTWRVEVKIAYEYIPTTTFRIWGSD